MFSSVGPALYHWLPRAMVVAALVFVLSATFAPAANAACNGIPNKPKLRTPQSAIIDARKADLKWESADCANHYNIEVRKGKTWGRPVDAKYGMDAINYRTRRLERGQVYFWHIEACNIHGCKPSRWGTFVLTK